jgi:hypothetical protein
VPRRSFSIEKRPSAFVITGACPEPRHCERISSASKSSSGFLPSFGFARSLVIVIHVSAAGLPSGMTTVPLIQPSRVSTVSVTPVSFAPALTSSSIGAFGLSLFGGLAHATRPRPSVTRTSCLPPSRPTIKNVPSLRVRTLPP